MPSQFFQNDFSFHRSIYRVSFQTILPCRPGTAHISPARLALGFSDPGVFDGALDDVTDPEVSGHEHEGVKSGVAGSVPGRASPRGPGGPSGRGVIVRS